MLAQSSDSVLTDASYSPVPPDTESYIHLYSELTDHHFPSPYPMLDGLTDTSQASHTSTPAFTSPFVQSTATDLSAEITEITDSSESGDLEQVYAHLTYLSASGEARTSDDGVYYPPLPIESHNFPALWDSQYAEGFTPLTTTALGLDTTNSVYTSFPLDASSAYPTLISPLDYCADEPMLEGRPGWNLDSAYSEGVGMNQLLQNSMALGDWQPTYLSCPTTFYMKDGASLTIETTLKVSPAVCRCGRDYLPAMNVSEYQQKSLEYC
ncbi:hypothetical protein EYR40_004664 [Pleurotus pulmonarius]|nr:hypothetical protein EYR38_001908 [Pleurotus pulmonarius]KAF4605873.1 hypothetical protein EYR40_004664 [Pleurotus pulmonarius]